MRAALLLALVPLAACGRSDLLGPGDRLAPTTPEPMTPTEPEPSCVVVGWNAEVHTAETFYLEAPYVTGRAVVFANADGQLDGIDVIDVDTHQMRPMFEHRAHRRILDARDGAIAWTEGGSDGIVLYYEHPDVGRQVAAVGLTFHPLFGGNDLGARQTFVDRHGLIYLERDWLAGWTPEAGRAFITGRDNTWNVTYGGGHVAVYAEGASPNGRPFDVYTIGEGLQFSTPPGADAFAPALTREHLYYSESGRVAGYRIESATRFNTSISAGCRVADAQGLDVLARCPRPRSEFASHIEVALGSEVFRRDADGGVIGAAQLHDGLVAYVHYESEDALCRGNGVGQIRLWDPRAGRDGEILVSEVGAPCTCCDAIAPRFGLEFEDRVLAWNYALTDDGRSAVGYATLEPIESCN